MNMKRFNQWVRDNLDTLAIVVGIILGLITGFALKSLFTISPLALTYIGLPGTLIIRSIKLLIVPLLIASLSSSITATKRDDNKRLIGLTFGSILTSLSVVVIFSLVLMVICSPGVGQMNDMKSNDNSNSVDINKVVTTQDEAVYDVLLNLVPDNIIGATFMTHYTAVVPIDPRNSSLGHKKVSEKAFKPNTLGLCAFSLILGFAVLHLGDKAEAIKRLLNESNALVMTLLMIFVKLMPLGMFSWMCVEAIRMKSPETVMARLGWFMGTTFLTFATIWLLIWPGLYFLILRRNLFKIYYNIIPAMIVAISSLSSAITLPYTMKCMEEKNNLSLPISRFVLPLGMTIHMPGTAIYYPMVGVFVAQMQSIPVTFIMLFTLLIYTVVQSMSLPAAPAVGSNLVFFVATCSVIGIDNPMDILAYIMAIDWIMERLRTVTNIMGDCVIAMIGEKFCHNKSDKNPDQEIQIESI